MVLGLSEVAERRESTFFRQAKLPQRSDAVFPVPVGDSRRAFCFFSKAVISFSKNINCSGYGSKGNDTGIPETSNSLMIRTTRVSLSDFYDAHRTR